MKKHRAWFFLFLLALCSETMARAGTTNTITLKPGEGLTQAMEDAGCDLGWLSRVMDMNDIPAATLRRLPVGATYDIPENCNAAAPQQIYAYSTMIMWGDSAIGRRRSERVSLARLEEENETYRSQLAEAREQIAALQSRQSRKPEEPAPVNRFNWSIRLQPRIAWIVLAILAAAVCILAAVIAKAHKEHRKRMKEEDESLAAAEERERELRDRIYRSVMFEKIIEVDFRDGTEYFSLYAVRMTDNGKYVGCL